MPGESAHANEGLKVGFAARAGDTPRRKGADQPWGWVARREAHSCLGARSAFPRQHSQSGPRGTCGLMSAVELGSAVTLKNRIENRMTHPTQTPGPEKGGVCLTRRVRMGNVRKNRGHRGLRISRLVLPPFSLE